MKQLRMLAVALVATAALVAVVAEGASAAGKFGLGAGETYPAALEGNQTVGGEHVFKIENDTLEVKCPVARFTGGEITGETSEIKNVVPEYKGEGEKTCKAFGLNATISMNGCTYTFRSETEVVKEMEYTGTADVVCPAGKSITVVTATCEVQIGAQTGLGPDTYVVDTLTPAEKDDTTIISGISKKKKYKETKDGIGCPLTHLNEERTDGSYTGVTTGIEVDPVTHARKESKIRP